MGKILKTPLDRVLAETADKGMKDKDIAAKFSITPGRWNQWKNRGIPSKEIAMVAARLGRSIAYITNGENHEPKPVHTPLDVDMLRQVIQTVEELLQEAEVTVTAETRAPVFAAMYDNSMRMGRVDKDAIKVMLKVMIANF